MGRIEGLLYHVVQKGDKIKGKLLSSSKFMLDLYTKVFGHIDKKGNITQVSISKTSIVDVELRNPERQSDFQIDGAVVACPEDCKFPFAITQADSVEVFWA